LLPTDIIGSSIFSREKGSFVFLPGPLFTSVLLADELNRATPRTQSALLQAMAEGQCTAENQTFSLPPNFFVIATQNPVEQHGTFPLPEAQLDRFLLKVRVDYPTKDEERRILDLMSTNAPKTDTQQVIDAERVTEARALVNDILISDAVRDYIVEIIHTSRYPGELLPDMKNLIRCGASPRGTINLALAARARAFLDGRAYVTPQDVKDLAMDVLRHRILLTYEAEAEGVTSEQIIERLLERIAVP
jgi:MoxR-like ATPase